MAYVKHIPDGMQTVTPHIVCANAAEAIELFRLDGKDGKLMHACIEIGDSKIMMADEYPDWGSVGPNTLKGTPVTLHLYVEDADRAFTQAVNAGATVKMPLADILE